uniref:Uncharacterized protein n=1 Tax=Phasianus colchicus TaxID=9054 RepID=A0A669PM07_PHACC
MKLQRAFPPSVFWLRSLLKNPSSCYGVYALKINFLLKPRKHSKMYNFFLDPVTLRCFIKTCRQLEPIILEKQRNSSLEREF